jgi:hypothetical protein
MQNIYQSLSLLPHHGAEVAYSLMIQVTTTKMSLALRMDLDISVNGGNRSTNLG